MPFDIWSELVVTALCGASLVVWIGRDLAHADESGEPGVESTLSQTEIQQCSRDLILGGSATGNSSSISRYETISSSARAARSALLSGRCFSDCSAWGEKPLATM